MSRKMKGFADYFVQGMQMGGQWANQWEAHAIARERNKLKAQADAIRNAREDKKLALYGHGVMANAELARARAANVGKTKGGGGGGGGGGGAGATSADTAALLKEANERGIIVTPSAAPAQTNITVTGNGDGGGIPDVPQPPGDGGGTNDYAGGGIVEGMSLQEAQGYSPEFTPSSKPRQSAPAAGGGAMGGAMSKAVTSGIDAYKKAREPKKDEPKVTPTAAKGTGEGGKYTVADSQPGGVLDTGLPPTYRAGGAVRNPPRRDPNIVREPVDATEQDERYVSGSWYAEGGTVRFRRGGAVRRYEEGGAVASDDLTQGYDWKAAEKEREQKTQQQQTEQVAQQAQQKEEEETKKKQASGDTGGGFASSFSDALSGSANGATGSGGDSTGGVSGTGGVGGSATDGSGGSAAAGTSGDAGSDGGGTYQRGGRVRRFQSGGRVMREQAIDTGTSGPGSGYGYRAAPPSRRY